MAEKQRHPLADTFNIGEAPIDDSFELSETDDGEEGYLAVPQSEIQPPAVVDDEEDKEITGKINEIYDNAMQAYQNQTAYVEIMEPRYAARNAEVAANYLNTALNAVALRARVKNEKRKASSAFVPYKHGGSAANIVVADRNEILRMMAEGNGPIIDGGR